MKRRGTQREAGMIESISLRNFQAHKDSFLEFCPGVNAITGKSDNGKTSIVRAFVYARYNRPTSNNFPSHFIRDKKGNLTDRMNIQVQNSKGVVSRFRDKDSNGYCINGDILKAISTDLPEQVSSLLNLSEVNIQKQLDSHFLLSDTPGQIAQFFNNLVNMDEIDTYLSAVDSLKRKTAKELKEAEESLLRAEKEIEKFNFVERAKELSNSISEKEESIKLWQKEIAELKKGHQEHSDLSKQLLSLPDTKKLERLFREAVESANKSDSAKKELTQANLSLSVFLDAKKELSKIPDLLKAERVAKEISKMPDTELLRLDISALSDSLEDFFKLSKKLKDLPDTSLAESLYKKISAYEQKIKALPDLERQRGLVQQHESFSHKLMNCLSELASLINQLPDICPTCGKKIKERSK